MAKHDRRKTSGRPPQLATRHDPGAAAGARRGQRCPGSVPWLLHRDRAAGPGGDDGGGPEVLCGPKGHHQVERPAWRGGSVDSI